MIQRARGEMAIRGGLKILFSKESTGSSPVGPIMREWRNRFTRQI